LHSGDTIRALNSLTGKVAFVTGGARRIGRAIVLALADAGADVVFCSRSESPAAAQTLRLIADRGRRGQFLICDVRSERSVQQAVADIVEQFGRIDIVVNNAARFEQVPLGSVTVEQWDAVFETNTRGPFLVVREALVHLRSVSGRVVNIGSLGGVNAWATHGHYCASKAALHMLTETMAKAFAPEVSVNCVAPGWIEFAEFGVDQAAHFAAITPMRRNGTGEDVAAAVLFFASGPAFITGQTLVVDGGLGL